MTRSRLPHLVRQGCSRPNTSNLDFAVGQVVSNLAIVPVGANGRIELANAGPGHTNLVADVVGYFTRGKGNTFVPVTPLRAFDTRKGGPIPARSQTLGSSQLLVARTAGVVMNVTVTNTHAGGFVLAGPRPLPAGLAQRVDGELERRGADGGESGDSELDRWALHHRQ